jgi:hypothetical protein
MRSAFVPALLLAAFVSLAAAAQEPNVNVSNLPGPQAEPTIAIHATDGRVLLAGSNSFSEGTMRAYGSTDGGRTWETTTVFPPPRDPDDTCAADPGVGIDRAGRQYYSFIRSSPCTEPPRLYVASRAGPDAAWGRPVLVAPLAGARFDDKPALAVDRSTASPHRNRVYVAWTRIGRDGVFRILVSSSDDGGSSWSKPVLANRTGEELTYVTLATSRRGVLYVGWHDALGFDIRVVRSTDGGRTFGAESQAVAFAIVTIPACKAGIVIPAQRLTCARPNPILAVDTSRGRYAGRVYLSYTHIDFQGDKGVAVTVFDARLRPLAGYPLTKKPLLVSPPSPTRHADQFWPASAVDPADGTLWVCFYDTKGDLERKKAWFSCTTSSNGGTRWSPAVRAATAPSDETQPDADSREYGDYQGLAVANGVAHPIWTDGRDRSVNAEEIYTTVLKK